MTQALSSAEWEPKPPRKKPAKKAARKPAGSSRSSGATPSASEKSASFWDDGGHWLGLALAGVVAPFTAVSLAQPEWTGAAGTAIAGAFSDFAGITGWLLPGLSASLGLHLLLPRTHRPWQLSWAPCLLWADMVWLAQRMGSQGGWLGAQIDGTALSLVGPAGSWLGAGLGLVASALAVCRIPPSQVARWSRGGLLHGVGAVGSWMRSLPEQWRAAKFETPDDEPSGEEWESLEPSYEEVPSAPRVLLPAREGEPQNLDMRPTRRALPPVLEEPPTRRKPEPSRPLKEESRFNPASPEMTEGPVAPPGERARRGPANLLRTPASWAPTGDAPLLGARSISSPSPETPGLEPQPLWSHQPPPSELPPLEALTAQPVALLSDEVALPASPASRFLEPEREESAELPGWSASQDDTAEEGIPTMPESPPARIARPAVAAPPVVELEEPAAEDASSEPSEPSEEQEAPVSPTALLHVAPDEPLLASEEPELFASSEDEPVVLPSEEELPGWCSSEPALAAPSALASEGLLVDPDGQFRLFAGDAPAPAVAYKLPPLALLDEIPLSHQRPRTEDKSADLLDALASFGVQANLLALVQGPTVTRYELQPARGVKVSRFTSLTNDIALALAAKAVRIEAPIPGKSAIGIEIPNEQTDLVVIRDIIGSSKFRKSAGMSIALGKDLQGNPTFANLGKMPHLLVAGTTGSGKSVCINALIISLLYRFTPAELQLLMIDPKQVELSIYEGIPHLITLGRTGDGIKETSAIICDPKRAAMALHQIVELMEHRYGLFAAQRVRNLEEYNATGEEPLPWVVVIIDELADLMMVASKSVETSICRIAQKARAAGIHLVLATQRPSADVITGLIKVNVPSRIAFAVSSQVDSRVILDTGGAEQLLGKGDMLFCPVDASDPGRLQGCYVKNEEILRVVEWWRAQGTPDNLIQLAAGETAEEAEEEEEGSEDDLLVEQALGVIVRRKQASASLLQTELKVGYARARRLIYLMEKKGYIGPAEGSKPRKILYAGGAI